MTIDQAATHDFEVPRVPTMFERIARRVGQTYYDEPPTTEWRVNASCRDTDPGLFFPIGTTGPAVEQIESAQQVCRGCPCQQACLEYALRSNQDSGVWGGASEEQRRHLRRTYIGRRRARR